MKQSEEQSKKSQNDSTSPNSRTGSKGDAGQAEGEGEEGDRKGENGMQTFFTKVRPASIAAWVQSKPTVIWVRERWGCDDCTTTLTPQGGPGTDSSFFCDARLSTHNHIHSQQAALKRIRSLAATCFLPTICIQVRSCAGIPAQHVPPAQERGQCSAVPRGS